jgi:hypothetical protein
MKITMYELLGMVKDGKELPKLENEVEKDFAYYVYDKWGDTCNLKDLKKILNDEVEILEEEKKIPEKLGKIDDNDGYIDQNDVIKIGKKVDEIIDYLKSKGDE